MCEKKHSWEKWSYRLLKRQGTILFVAKRIVVSETCQNQSRARQHGRRCHHCHFLSALNRVDEGCGCTNETRHITVEGLRDDILVGTSLCESMFCLDLEGRWIHQIHFCQARTTGVMVRGPVLGISMVCGYITICNSSCNESPFGA